MAAEAENLCGEAPLRRRAPRQGERVQKTRGGDVSLLDYFPMVCSRHATAKYNAHCCQEFSMHRLQCAADTYLLSDIPPPKRY
jgi:hypothetical protein